MQGKRGVLKVKPEIGTCDNNFKEQKNHPEMFLEEFHSSSSEITPSPAMICARESMLTARLVFFFFFGHLSSL